MKLIPFHREHLTLLDPREYERECLLPYISDQFLNAAESLPHCYSLIKDGRIITCAGVFPLWNGVYEAWQIPSIYVTRYIKEYCKDIKGWLDTAAERLKARRIQTTSPADALHDRWMTFIGFECEGTLKEYSRFGKDHRLWARRYSHGS